MDASTGARAESGVGLETFRGLKAALDGLGVQEREAVRVRVRLAAHVTAPLRMYCETVDLSVLGVRFDRELPCAPGERLSFTVEIPAHSGTKPEQLRLAAEVVRTQPGDTGLRFVQISTEQKRTIRAIVHAQQDLLAGRRAARHGLLRVQAS
jgi:hypothetical protein